MITWLDYTLLSRSIKRNGREVEKLTRQTELSDAGAELLVPKTGAAARLRTH